MKRHKAEWQASEARGRFAEVIDAALAGMPQVIRKRGGGEVVVVSRAAWERSKPTLREVLLAGGGGPQDAAEDIFERALRDARQQGIGMFGARDIDHD